jgi:tetratricopeptide (TPR) repeat protein
MLMRPLLDVVLWLSILHTALVPLPVRDVKGSWVNKRIMLKQPNVQASSERVKDKAKYVAYLTDILYSVEADQEGWVRVNHHGTVGWIEKNAAVIVEEAVPFFSTQIRDDPKDARAYAHRAWAYKELGKLDAAIADYSETIRLQPQVSAWFNNRGVVWREKRDYDRALDDFGEAIRLAPQSFHAYRNRASLWAFQKEYDKALADYNQVLQLMPKDARAHNDRGWLWTQRKEYDKALVDLEAAMQLDPASELPYVNRGNVWCRQKEYARAQADYDTALRLNRSSILVKNSQAWFLATCPDPKHRHGKQAVAFAHEACERAAWKTASYIDTLAAACAEDGDFANAVRYQRQALNFPEFAESSGPAARERLRLYQEGKAYREP